MFQPPFDIDEFIKNNFSSNDNKEHKDRKLNPTDLDRLKEQNGGNGEIIPPSEWDYSFSDQTVNPDNVASLLTGKYGKKIQDIVLDNPSIPFKQIQSIIMDITDGKINISKGEWQEIVKRLSNNVKKEIK